MMPGLLTRRPEGWRPRRFVVAAVALLGLAWTPAASAHPSLLQSDPAPGLVSKQAPERISLSFTEPMEASGSAVTVKRLDGRRVATGTPIGSEHDATLTVPLRDSLRSGVYAVTWSVLGTDGHQVSGSFRIGVAGPRGAAPPGIEQLGAAAGAGSRAGGTSSSTDGLVPVVMRWIGLLAAAFLLGAWLLGRRARADGIELPDGRLAAWAWAIALAAALEAAVAVAANGADGGLDAGLLTGTASGVLALVRIGVLAVLGAAALRLRAPALFGVAAALALATHALDGHTAAVTDDRLLAWVESLAHVEASAIWAGGLIAIVLWSARGAPARELVRAFTPIAAVAMVVLAVAGVLTAVREVDSWMFLRWSGYGRVVIVKSALVVAVLAFAGWTVWRGRQDGAAPSASRRPAAPLAALRVEALAAVAVLALAATLAGLVQGRGQPLYAQRGSMLTGAGLATAATPKGPVQLTVAPGRPGANTISAIPQALREGELPRGAREIVVRLACECERDGQRVALRRSGPGVWSARVNLSAEGTWFAYVGVDGSRPTAPVALSVDDPREGGPSPLAIRTTADLTGDGAERCRSFVQGLALGVGRLNASGGVDGGRKVALDVRDDGGDPRRAAALVRDGVPGVVAPCGPGGAGAIRAAGDALALAADPATPVADSRDRRVFRLAGDPRAEGIGLGRFLIQAGLRNEFGSPKRIAVVVADAAGEQRLAGLRSALAGRGLTIERLPADAAESARTLRRVASPHRYLATLIDGDPIRVAAAVREFGGPEGRVLPSMLFASPRLANEPFMLAAGPIGRLGMIRVLSEVSPDARDALAYSNGVQGLYRGERPRLAGLRGFVAALTIAEAARGGSDSADMARRLVRPRKYTDALTVPWRADRPAAGAQAFAIYGPNFLPANLIPARAGGENYSGTFFQQGSWSRIGPYVYGPAVPTPQVNPQPTG